MTLLSAWPARPPILNLAALQCTAALVHTTPGRSVPNVVCSCVCHAPCQLGAALGHANRVRELEIELAVANEELQQERDARALLEAQHSELEEMVSRYCG